MRNWNFGPRFAHVLIDQAGLDPKPVQGGIRARILQLLMFATYHEPIREALELAAALLAQLTKPRETDLIFSQASQPE